ncbi:hypothetical protein [Streptomyces boluensis]|uniref:Uncharacterized protein n=1 Tax=Streptomyces boluensis TaxID=1775135 RepID=A0A964XLC5_9ACTN|nr:hypothetical protein [Streptomyces boluensis]NBE51607.1 hypothetical protein [Streptomyces boluensis]
MKRWMVGVWLVLVVGGWALTEYGNDSIEPSSGRTEPEPTAPSVPGDAECPTREREPGTIVACSYKVDD